MSIPILSLDPSHCLEETSDFRQENKSVGKGVAAAVFSVCKKDTKDCDYVVRRSRIETRDDHFNLLRSMNAYKKLKVPYVASPIYAKICKDESVMVFPKYEKTLWDLWKSRMDKQKNREFTGIIFEEDIIKVILILRQLNRTGFVHADAHPVNIMIKKDGSFVLIDFERAGDFTEFYPSIIFLKPLEYGYLSQTSVTFKELLTKFFDFTYFCWFIFAFVKNENFLFVNRNGKAEALSLDLIKRFILVFIGTEMNLFREYVALLEKLLSKLDEFDFLEFMNLPLNKGLVSSNPTPALSIKKN